MKVGIAAVPFAVLSILTLLTFIILIICAYCCCCCGNKTPKTEPKESLLDTCCKIFFTLLLVGVCIAGLVIQE